MSVEQRAVPAALVASEDGMQFSGHAAVFSPARTYIGPAKKGFFEEVAPGAFRGVLAARADVRMLIDHDPSRLLARTRSGTLTLTEDRTGLHAEAKLPPTQLGRDTAALIARGDLSGQSMSFTVARDSWSTLPGGHAQLRVIEEIASLIDIGPCSAPAYPSTTASVRSALDTAPAEVRSALLAAVEPATPSRTPMSPAIAPYHRRRTVDLRRDLEDSGLRPEFVETQQRSAFASWLRTSLQGFGTAVEARDIGVAAGSAGGFLVPQGFGATVVEAQRFFSAVRRLANTITTDSGNDMPWPTNDDTTNVGVIGAENVVITSLDTSWTSKTVKAFMYESLLEKVSWQLMNDSAFDLETFLARKMGQRIGRLQNTHLSTGTGTGQPEGVYTVATVGATLATGGTTTLGTATSAYGSLVDLMFSVDVGYREMPSCAWMAHDLTWAAVRKLSDSSTRPFFVDATAPGSKPTMFGFPCVTNPDAPQMAANNKTILFGALDPGYQIRDVQGLAVKHLHERFADTLADGVFGYLRTDGRLLDQRCCRVLQQSAT